MPDKKLTDNEIKKALECCTKRENRCCNDAECPLFYKTATYSECRWKLLKETTDLINRLQAENERLQNTLDDVLDRQPTLVERSEKYAKAEAYKECIEKVKEIDCSFYVEEYYLNGEMYSRFRTDIFNSKLDTILKELVGEDNAETQKP